MNCLRLTLLVLLASPATAAGEEMPSATLLAPHDPASPLARAIEMHGLAQPLERLKVALEHFHEARPEGVVLSRTLSPFIEPFALPELADAVSAPAAGVGADPGATALTLLRENLDQQAAADTAPFPATLPATQPSTQPSAGPSTQPVSLPPRLLDPLHRSADLFQRALPPELPVEPAGRAEFIQNVLALLRVPSTSFYIPEARADLIETLRITSRTDRGMLIHSFAALAELLNVPNEMLVPQTGPIPLPAELEGAVEGTILAAGHIDSIGWVVIGGAETNRYDLSRVAVVVDAGGNDQYEGKSPATGIRAIIDLAGNDRYTGDADSGPAGVVLGLSLIDDRAGNDRYGSNGVLGCGAAAVGVALLCDRAGNDQYVSREVSQGAAFVGGGFLFDLGGGADSYTGRFLCQGVGLTAGVGALIDAGGRDLYRVNGSKGSAYGTPAVSFAMSQGIGFGFRRQAAGGVGLLSDLGGDDRYEAGEFAQGGAYSYGLGVLRDWGGRDLYYGNRYGQGFGVHQAHGALIDDSGDDTYWSMTAASQGSAWDAGVGLLLDKAGNDSYQADGLAQGGASNQSIGMLIDLGGNDRYSAAGGAIQGQVGSNNYHWKATLAGSFALLLDLGSGEDVYSTGRPNDAITLTDPPPPTTQPLPKTPLSISGVSIDE